MAASAQSSFDQDDDFPPECYRVLAPVVSCFSANTCNRWCNLQDTDFVYSSRNYLLVNDTISQVDCKGVNEDYCAMEMCCSPCTSELNTLSECVFANTQGYKDVAQSCPDWNNCDNNFHNNTYSSDTDENDDTYYSDTTYGSNNNNNSSDMPFADDDYGYNNSSDISSADTQDDTTTSDDNNSSETSSGQDDDDDTTSSDDYAQTVASASFTSAAASSPAHDSAQRLATASIMILGAFLVLFV